MRQIRLYLDEDVDPQLAEDLRRRGFDVEAPAELGRLGEKDRDQLDYAQRTARAILTHNRDDFLKLAQRFALENLSHPGILYIPQLAYRHLLRRVSAFLSATEGDQVENLFTWIP
ncbi:MAG: DUF5615 family PIN-like protein [candidate division NC10 bacterium]|nr:DUF5615 family PIN-like protein [candidate division NC10 bacterium]